MEWRRFWRVIIMLDDQYIMSTIRFGLRSNKRNIKSLPPEEHCSGSEEIHFPVYYRLLFYVGGIVFALVSYIAGVWSFSMESATWGLAAFSGNLIDHVSAHVLSFFVWAVICTGVSVIIGTLFYREFTFRIKAEKLADMDGLTGLYNHAYFQKRLDEEVDRATRHNSSLSIIMLDLDNFKIFNDTWGHQEGDRLLILFSEILHKSVRNHDIVSRYGGEEFVIILPETDGLDAITVAERIIDAARRYNSASKGDGKQVTVSAGVSTFPAHGQTKRELLANADTALYQAKNNGKNQALAFTSDITQLLAVANSTNSNKF